MRLFTMSGLWRMLKNLRENGKNAEKSFMREKSQAENMK